MLSLESTEVDHLGDYGYILNDNIIVSYSCIVIRLLKIRVQV